VYAATAFLELFAGRDTDASEAAAYELATVFSLIRQALSAK
jgi:hypothetical protein